MLGMWTPGLTEMIVIGAVALLIFGRRLPDVARSVGKSIVEFKKGLRDVKDDADASAASDNRILPERDVQSADTAASSSQVSKTPQENK